MTDPIDENRRYLTAALGPIRDALTRHAGGEPAPGVEAMAWVETHHDAPIEKLSAAFGLSWFERNVLLLCAGVEFETRVATNCAEAHGDPMRPYPTFGLALAIFPDAHWSALAPSGPLRYWRLVEVGAGPLTAAPLRIDERVLHYLVGVDAPDDRLAGLLQRVPPTDALVPSHRELADRVCGAWERGDDPVPVVQLCGGDAADRRAVAASACEKCGWGLHLLLAHAVPTAPAELDAFLRLWGRESKLGSGALLLDYDDQDGTDPARTAAITRLVEAVTGPVLVTAREPRRSQHRPALILDVRRPTAAEERDVWREALGLADVPLVACIEDAEPTDAPEDESWLDELVMQFRLTGPAVRAAAAEARGRRSGELKDAVWDACRVQARARLDDLARRIESSAAPEDLILPAAQEELLTEVVAHVNHRAKVFEKWMFAPPNGRGLGVAALFAGPSGTGKTLAAEVLANQLRLDLYHIDLSQVISKYIGETERNLRRVFDAAEDGGAVLLFDEADALFGRRTEVKDSHDRYANIEVSYLLQRMEAYRGLAILTTNFKEALDPAFLRRLRFVIPFPFPGPADRARIWARAFPKDTTEGVRVEALARLSVPGGSIRNIALHAAFLAARDNTKVNMGHLLRAARVECAKLERVPTEAEIGGWV